MKKKQLAAGAAADNTSVVTETASKPKKVKKVAALQGDLHYKFWLLGFILAAVSILFTLIAKNAINGTGFWQVELFKSWLKKPLVLKMEFMTSLRASIVAIIAGVFGVGFGITRNVLKRQNNLSGYIVPLVALILAVFAFCASYFVS